MSIPSLVGTQLHQAARIGAGVRDGSLTKDEAKQLVGQERATGQALVSAKQNDGVVTKQERADLRGQQAQNSKDIFEARHNSDTQPARPRVDRQQNQATRIRDGVQDGSLTKPEATRLAKAEVRTDGLIAKSKLDDGKIGPRESQVIERRQDATSKAIYALKHNDRAQES